MKTIDLVKYCNDLLDIRSIKDPGYNGLQVDHEKGEVTRLAFAVDASLESFAKTSEAKAQMLIVHHGLMWDKFGPITGITYKRIKFLIDHDIALYAVHLPLDAHPQLGHNAQMARLLQLQNIDPFGEYHGIELGVVGNLPEPVLFDAFCEEFRKINKGSVTVLSFGATEVNRIAIVSGGGSSAINEAIAKNVDVFITGESTHSFYHTIKEGNLNVILAGHYNSEKFGLVALAEHLCGKYNVETTFIEAPTGF